MPSLGPVQYEPLRHEQSPTVAGACFLGTSCTEPPMYAVHDLLLALVEPSLQMKVSPWQCAMPPFLPLQGVSAACVGGTTAMLRAAKVTIVMSLPIRSLECPRCCLHFVTVR